MGTRAVVLLDNPSFFSSDDRGEMGRADSGFYVHYDGYPDTLGQALLQMGRSGAFDASSMIASGEISYFTGIYPNNSNPGGPEDGDRVVELGGGATGLAGVDDGPMGNYASDYRFSPDYMIEIEDGDMGDADYIYVVGDVGVWYDSPGYGTQGFAEYGGRFASGHLASERTAGRKMATRYPEIEVELVGNDGNAFAVLGAVQKALRRAGVPQDEIDEFMDDATSGDYDHLLQVCMEWVEVY